MLDTLLNLLERRGISRSDLKRDYKLPPNWVSYVRILLSPGPMIMLICWPDVEWVRWAAVISFIVLAFSDAIDGWLARRNNGKWSSSWGALIDPIGDKLLVCFTFVGLLAILWNDDDGFWLCLLVWLVFAREFIITAQIRMAQTGIMKPTFLGKAKTAVQMAAIVAWMIPIAVLGDGLIAITTVYAYVFTLMSWDEYYDLYVRPSRTTVPTHV